MDNAREELKWKIYSAKMEYRTARGFHHRRDMRKHIHRMEKELLLYDKYQQAAKAARG
jgi:hypothetical protein